MVIYVWTKCWHHWPRRAEGSAAAQSSQKFVHDKVEDDKLGYMIFALVFFRALESADAHGRQFLEP
jgi:hypothetical protein